LSKAAGVFSVGSAWIADQGPADSEEQPMASTPETQSAPEEPVIEETLVEEVSIDGMCGVY
jgi:mycofactocin precursor peptide MftA